MSRAGIRNKPWTKRELTLLRKSYSKLPNKKVALLFPGRTKLGVVQFARKIGLHRERDDYRRWTAPDLKLLRDLYPKTPTPQLAARLGRPAYVVFRKARVIGLKKDPAYMAALLTAEGQRLRIHGAPHRFYKGHVPANKGLRRPGYAPGRMAQTQFKKGQKGHNWQPVGTVKFNADGYLVRKIADEPNAGIGAHSTNWEFVHRRVWEDAHGAIPKGYRIWWKDGNHGNCKLENLELLSGQEHIARTTFHKRLPPELASTILKLGWLKRRIRKIEGEGSDVGNEKQNGRSARSPVHGAGAVERRDDDERNAHGPGARSREGHLRSRPGDRQLRQSGSGVHQGHGPRSGKRVPRGKKRAAAHAGRGAAKKPLDRKVSRPGR